MNDGFSIKFDCVPLGPAPPQLLTPEGLWPFATYWECSRNQRAMVDHDRAFAGRLTEIVDSWALHALFGEPQVARPEVVWYQRAGEDKCDIYGLWLSVLRRRYSA